jgi:hypothetical protein
MNGIFGSKRYLLLECSVSKRRTGRHSNRGTLGGGMVGGSQNDLVNSRRPYALVQVIVKMIAISCEYLAVRKYNIGYIFGLLIV